MYSDRDNIPNNKKRKALYQLYVYEKYGHLGKSVRIPIVLCVVNGIRELWTEESAQYDGFRSV